MSQLRSHFWQSYGSLIPTFAQHAPHQPLSCCAQDASCVRCPRCRSGWRRLAIAALADMRDDSQLSQAFMAGESAMQAACRELGTPSVATAVAELAARGRPDLGRRLRASARSRGALAHPHASLAHYIAQAADQVIVVDTTTSNDGRANPWRPENLQHDRRLRMAPDPLRPSRGPTPRADDLRDDGILRRQRDAERPTLAEAPFYQAVYPPPEAASTGREVESASQAQVSSILAALEAQFASVVETQTAAVQSQRHQMDLMTQTLEAVFERPEQKLKATTWSRQVDERLAQLEFASDGAASELHAVWCVVRHHGAHEAPAATDRADLLCHEGPLTTSAHWCTNVSSRCASLGATLIVSLRLWRMRSAGSPKASSNGSLVKVPLPAMPRSMWVQMSSRRPRLSVSTLLSCTSRRSPRRFMCLIALCEPATLKVRASSTATPALWTGSLKCAGRRAPRSSRCNPQEIRIESSSSAKFL